MCTCILYTSTCSVNLHVHQVNLQVNEPILTPLQLSEHQQSLSASLSQLSQLQSQLNALELTKVQLQQLLDEKSKEERLKEAQLKLLEAQLSDKTEQLTNAENKIQVNHSSFDST